MERPFHMYFTEIIIDNNQIKRNVITSKSNWQEGNLLEELNPGEVVVWRGGGGGKFFADAGHSEPLPHYNGRLFCGQK